MTAKILKKTGEVVPGSNIRPLMLEEMDNTDLKEQRRNFDEAVIANLDEPAAETNFLVKDLTPTYDAYVDNITERTPDSLWEDLKPTPEANENYMNAYVMLPCSRTKSRWRVIEGKRDTDGNHVEQANENPILDSCHYLVKFKYGEFNELTENFIAESIYAIDDPEI